MPGLAQVSQSHAPLVAQVPLVGPLGAVPAWSADAVRAMQTELARLGCYRLRVDGVCGPGTVEALTEAFGGDSWRSLDGDAAMQQLQRSNPQPGGPGTRGQRRFLWGAMCADGVLDVTIGVGFDEDGAHLPTLATVEQALAQHGFALDVDAAEVLYQRAGRGHPKQAYGRFFVRKSALTLAPPASAARAIDCVVRLVDNRDGNHGVDAASAFKYGLELSDVAYYAGHARYGSGPDFDRLMRFELVDDSGGVTAVPTYEDLEQRLTELGRPSGRDAWHEFLARVGDGRLRVYGSNAGDVYLNPVDQHTSEFGGALLYWNLARIDRTPVTGPRGELATRDPRRAYHLWLFDGCRTDDYVRAIRATPDEDPRKTDLVVTRRITYWGDKGRVCAAFLDGLMAQDTAEALVARMTPAFAMDPEPGVLSLDGLDDNPVVP